MVLTLLLSMVNWERLQCIHLDAEESGTQTGESLSVETSWVFPSETCTGIYSKYSDTQHTPTPLIIDQKKRKDSVQWL